MTKHFPIFLILIGGLIPLRGQVQPAPQWDVEIPVPIADGTPSTPVSKPEPINLKIQTSHTTQVHVTQAPEMPGLPVIEGMINVTVQKVDNPGLPDPQSPLPARPPDEPTFLARIAELRENYRATEMVFVSATVHDHSRTLLRVYPNGKVEDQIVAWSNIDFNHFGGFSTFRVRGINGTVRDYRLLMGIGNIDTIKLREGRPKSGSEFKEPVIPSVPDLAVSGPSFVVIEGDEAGEAMDTVAQFHDLYRNEGERMKAAYQKRVAAETARRALLLAHPPLPIDVEIQFWDNASTSQSKKEGTKEQ